MHKHLLMFLFLVILVCATPAQAHRVNIFAWVDGDTVHTDSGFSKRKRVQGGSVFVQDAGTDEVLLSGITDENGKFSFPIPQRARDRKMNLRLVLDASQGHRAEWVIRYAEYGEEPSPDHPVPAAVGEEPSPDSGHVVENPERLEYIIRVAVKKAVAEEIAPLKRMIAEMRDDEPGMREVLAGLGYLMGIAGLAAYMRARKK